MSIALGNGDLVITPNWTDTAKDEFNVETTTANAMDLTGHNVSLDVYLPENYVVDGKLAVQIYFKDANGHFGNGGWKEASWGPWRWSGSAVSTTNTAADNHYGWVTLTFHITSAGIDGSWGYNPDAIDITKITTFGLNLVSHGKPLNVTGDIKVDNVVLPGL